MLENIDIIPLHFQKSFLSLLEELSCLNLLKDDERQAEVVFEARGPG